MITPEPEHPQDCHRALSAVALRQTIMGFRATQLIHVAAKLGIADLLKDGPQSADDLARSTGTDPDALYRVLRALGSLGVFAETEDGRFRLTPLALLLQSEVPGSLRGLAILYGEEWYWRAYGALHESLRTGEPAFDHVHGVGLFDYLSGNDEAARVFNQAMTAYTEQEAQAILTAYDFTGLATVVDVGGGHGSLLATILQAYPRLLGILFDLPAVVEGARPAMTNAGVADRCALVTGDFFRAAPRGGEAYILKSVVHDWDNERAITILKNCRDAMGGDGRLLLIERLVPSGNAPSEAKLFDINMLVSIGGRERTAAEYHALLNAAGFRLTVIVPTQCPLSVIEAVPVGGTP